MKREIESLQKYNQNVHKINEAVNRLIKAGKDQAAVVDKIIDAAKSKTSSKYFTLESGEKYISLEEHERIVREDRWTWFYFGFGIAMIIAALNLILTP